MIKDVTDLTVYRESLDLVRKIYKLVNLLPKSEAAIINQLKRSAQSIPANIAEGFAKKGSDKEFKRYLLIALGSSDESITHLRTISLVLETHQDQAKLLVNEYKILSKKINMLYKKWNINQYKT